MFILNGFHANKTAENCTFVNPKFSFCLGELREGPELPAKLARTALGVTGKTVFRTPGSATVVKVSRDDDTQRRSRAQVFSRKN